MSGFSPSVKAQIDLERLSDEREGLMAAQCDWQREASKAIAAAREAGVTVKQIALLLGLSRQSVYRVVDEVASR